MTFHPLTGEDCGDLPALDRASLHWRERRAAQLVNRPRAADWHAARAAGLRRGFEAAVRRCSTWTAARCRCGERSAPTRCSRRVCAVCADKKRKRVFARLREGMDREARAAVARWSEGRGRLPAGEHRKAVPRWTMMTLTLRHSGDLTADLARIRRGWDRMRAWMRAELGRMPPFAFVVEVTPGRDQLGHVHAHVAILLPWVSWGRIRAAWAGHVGQDDASVDFNAGGKRGAKGRNARRNPVDAARYLAKYVGKPAKSLPVELQSDWLDACYQRRDVTCSRGLLAALPPQPCPTCGHTCTAARGGGAWHEWAAVMAAQRPETARPLAIPWTDITSCVLSRGNAAQGWQLE